MASRAESSSSFFVRPAHLDDLGAVVGYNAELALETEGKTLDGDVLQQGVARALDDPDRLRYWVAEDVASGRVIGQAAITREWTDWRNGWIWWFQSVFVHADFRRAGVFRALYAHVRDEALAAQNVIALRLYVEQDNARAQRTYQSLGMRPAGYHVYEEIWPERFGRDGHLT
jgi:GNAT superfamily N-acetyltransferase